MLSIKRQQLTTHISIVKENITKCYKHMSFFQMHTLMFLGVINSIVSISQNKESNKLVKNVIATKTQHDVSFFSHKK